MNGASEHCGHTATSAPEFVVVPEPAWDPDYPLASITVGGVDLGLALVDGEVFCFEDNCSHQQCRLTDGDLIGHTVVCPCHQGAFDVRSGDVVDGPPFDPIRVFPCDRLSEGVRITVETGGA